MNQKLIEALEVASSFYKGLITAPELEEWLLDKGFHSVHFSKSLVSARYLGVEYKLERL